MLGPWLWWKWHFQNRLIFKIKNSMSWSRKINENQMRTGVGELNTHYYLCR